MQWDKVRVMGIPEKPTFVQKTLDYGLKREHSTYYTQQK